MFEFSTLTIALLVAAGFGGMFWYIHEITNWPDTSLHSDR